MQSIRVTAKMGQYFCGESDENVLNVTMAVAVWL